jgi:hypothetical protein
MTENYLITLSVNIYQITCLKFHFQYGAERRAIFKTGGGTSADPGPSDTSQAIRSLIRGQIDPIPNSYDDDGKLNMYHIIVSNSILK